MNWFTSGSMSAHSLPSVVHACLTDVMNAHHHILVGDAKGTDQQIQRFCMDAGYERVIVFHVGSAPRVMVDKTWESRRVPIDETDPRMLRSGKLTRDAQAEKDREMARLADTGLAVLRDTSVNRFGNTVVSKGTLTNVYRLVASGKPVHLYLANQPHDGLLEVATVADLESLVNSSMHEATRRFFAKELASECAADRDLAVQDTLI